MIATVAPAFVEHRGGEGVHSKCGAVATSHEPIPGLGRTARDGLEVLAVLEHVLGRCQHLQNRGAQHFVL